LEEFLSQTKASIRCFPTFPGDDQIDGVEYVAVARDRRAFRTGRQDYTSTAPNRRYSDLITQRLLIAAIEDGSSPYSMAELVHLAAQCTASEDAANKVERQVIKSAAALLLEGRIGEQFDSIVTGASEKGTWVRLVSLPVEGRLMQGFEGVDVGDRINVRLNSVDVNRGYINFSKIDSARQTQSRKLDQRKQAAHTSWAP
jgi:hypothetical protein